jgi:hypothetical protein
VRTDARDGGWRGAERRLATVLWLLLGWLVIACGAQAQCGAIPSPFPLYAGAPSRLTVGNDARVNGTAITGTGNAVGTNGRRTNVTTALPSPSPDVFPSFSGGANSGTATIAESKYNEVILNGATRFTGGTYYIGKFEAKGIDVELAAGDYFVSEWSVSDNTRVTVASGPVRLFIGKKLDNGNGVRFNVGGDPANLLVALMGSATAAFGNDLRFTGVLVGSGSSTVVKAGNDAQLTGAMLVAGESGFGNGLRVTYSSSTQTQLAGFTTCRAALGEYRFEQTRYDGTAGEVITSAGTSNGRTSGGATSTASGRVCRGLSVPANTTISPTAGFDSGIPLGSAVGNVGTIMFWYRGNTAWNSGARKQLVDATSAATGDTGRDPYFYFVIAENGAAVLRLEDDRDNPHEVRTGASSIAANTWVHVAMTWDMLRRELAIHVNPASGASATAQTSISTSGERIGDLATIFFGDNRTQYLFDIATPNSADGTIDEVRIYKGVRTATEIARDRAETRPCAAVGIASFAVTAAASASTCTGQPITIRALDGAGNTLTSYAGTAVLSTSSGRGGWAASSTSGPVVESGTANDGTAQYTFRAADNGQAVLLLSNESADTLTVGARDSNVPSAVGTSASIAYRDLAFVIESSDVLRDLPVAARPHTLTATLWRREATSSGGTRNCGVATSYTGDRKLKAWVAHDRAHPVDADDASITATPGTFVLPDARPSGANVALSFASGVARFTLDTTDVGKYALNLLDDTRSFSNAVDLFGTSATLTVRPFALVMRDLVAGGNANPAGTATGGGRFAVAGDPFGLTLQAVRWTQDDDADNDGVPDDGAVVVDNEVTRSFAWDTTLSVDTSDASLFTPSGGVAGGLGGTTTLATKLWGKGTAQVADLAYTEVGSIGLVATAKNYLDTDGLVLTARATDGKSQKPVPVGRFVPASFALSNASVTAVCGSGLAAFTYMGQPGLRARYTLEARNRGNGITVNYQTGRYNTGTVTLVAENNNAGANLVARLAGLPATAWVGGGWTVDATTLAFARNASPDGPFDSLVLGAIVSDPDGAAVQAPDMNAASAGACGSNCNARALNPTSPTRVRFGRLRIDNALGSPSLDLPVRLSTEFWTGSGFATHADDSCTRLTNTQVAFGNWQRELSACSTSGTPIGVDAVVFTGGRATLRLTRPLRRGSVDLGVQLGATAAGSTCSAGSPSAVQAANRPWLQGNWGATTFDRNPVARAAFGLYSTTPDLIYRRESY